LVSLAVAAVLAYGVTAAVQVFTGVNEPWYASPVPVRVAVWLAALLGVVATGALFSRSIGFWGLSVGAWLVWALASVVTALALPGAAVVFLVPLVVATVAFVLALVTGGLGGSRAATTVTSTATTPATERLVRPVTVGAALVSLFTAGYVWLPLALAVESLMGMLLSAAVAVCLSLAFTTFSPLLAEAPRVARSRFSVRAAVLLVCVLGVAGAVVLAVRAPTFSALRPQRFSIAHVTEAVQGEEASASWLLDRYPDSRLPEAYLQLGDLRSTTPELLPMGGPFALSAVAPLL